jgi:hypothetical protein
MRDELEWSVNREGDALIIDTHLDETGQTISRNDLSGLTFYLPSSLSCRITLNQTPIENLQVNPPDHTGRPSVSVPWKRLEFPSL